MSWEDKDIDKLFQENAANTSFEYKNEYWEEFEAFLPVNKPKGGDFLWMTTAVLFLGIVTTLSIMNQSGTTTSFDDTTLFAATNPMLNESSQFEDVQAKMLAEQNDLDPLTNDLQIDRGANEGATPFNNQGKSKLSAGRTPKSSGNEAAYEGSEKDPNGAGSIPKAKIDPIVSGEDPSGLLVNASAGRLGDDVQNNNNIDALAVRALRFEDDKSVLDGLPAFVVAPIERRSAAHVYFEINGGLSQSIVSPSDQYSNSFGAGFGVEVQKGNFNFIAGVSGLISNHKDIQLNRNTVLYGFGSEVISTHLNYSEIYVVEANLSLGYSLGNHLVSIGLRPSYVVGSKVRDRRIIENKLVYDILGYGYMDGLRRFGLKPQIGYAYKFAHGFTIGGNIGIQTRKALNEDFVNGENNILPIDGRLYLRKTLFGNNKLKKTK
jgi:hypothetical protein